MKFYEIIKFLKSKGYKHTIGAPPLGDIIDMTATKPKYRGRILLARDLDGIYSTGAYRIETKEDLDKLVTGKVNTYGQPIEKPENDILFEN